MSQICTKHTINGGAAEAATSPYNTYIPFTDILHSGISQMKSCCEAGFLSTFTITFDFLTTTFMKN